MTGTFKHGAKIRPTRDVFICPHADGVRRLNGPEAPIHKAEMDAHLKGNHCTMAFCCETTRDIGDSAGERCDYTFVSYYDEDLVILLMRTFAKTGNDEPTAAVYFGRAQDFELIDEAKGA